MGIKSGTIPENPGQIITLTDSRTSFLFFNEKGQLDDWKLTVPTALVTERDVSCQGQRTALPLRMPPPPPFATDSDVTQSNKKSAKINPECQFPKSRPI